MDRKKIIMKNVSYSITEGGRKRKLLNDVNVEFDGEKITVISGPSGSGKTTLLYAMAGLLDNVDGSIYVGVNVEDNIMVPLYLKNRKITEEIRSKISHYLDVMCLGQIQKKSISNLSGGEQQRVAIIRALIDDPEVVLCDEPTASLDSENTRQFMETLVKISKESGAAIVIVTHDARVFAYGDVKVTMIDGELFYEKM